MGGFLSRYLWFVTSPGHNSNSNLNNSNHLNQANNNHNNNHVEDHVTKEQRLKEESEKAHPFHPLNANAKVLVKRSKMLLTDAELRSFQFVFGWLAASGNVHQHQQQQQHENEHEIMGKQQETEQTSDHIAIDMQNAVDSSTALMTRNHVHPEGNKPERDLNDQLKDVPNKASQAEIALIQNYSEFPAELVDKTFFFPTSENTGLVYYAELLELVMRYCVEHFGDKKARDSLYLSLFVRNPKEIAQREAERMFKILKELAFQNIVIQDHEHEQSTASLSSKPMEANEKEPSLQKLGESLIPIEKKMADRLFFYVETKGEKKETCSLDDFQEWKDRNAPKLFQTLEAIIYEKFLGKFKEDPKPRNAKLNVIAVAPLEKHSTEKHPAEKSEKFPKHGHDKNEPPAEPAMVERTRPYRTMPVINELSIPSILTQEVVWYLSCVIPETRPFVEEMKENHMFSWNPLYLSTSHGFSFNNFEQKSFDYPGATLLIVKDISGLVFGFYNSIPWKTQRNSYFGDKNAFLFETAPHVEICRAAGPQNNFVFYNSDSSLRSKSTGIGFGGEIKNPRIWINSNLQSGYYTRGEICQNLFIET